MILWMDFGQKKKKREYSLLWTQHRKKERKKNQAMLECFFPYSKDLAFQGLKIKFYGKYILQHETVVATLLLF